MSRGGWLWWWDQFRQWKLRTACPQRGGGFHGGEVADEASGRDKGGKWCSVSIEMW
jgi:hypothetical protein